MEKTLKIGEIEKNFMDGYIELQNQKFFRAYQYFTYCEYLLNLNKSKSKKD